MVKYYANIRICLYLCSIWLTFIRFLQPDEHNNMMHRFIYTILILVAGLAYTSCDPLEQNRPDNNQEHETTDPDTGNPDGDDKEESDNDEFVILFTNDFHSQIEPTDKNLDYNADRGGA